MGEGANLRSKILHANFEALKFLGCIFGNLHTSNSLKGILYLVIHAVCTFNGVTDFMDQLECRKLCRMHVQKCHSSQNLLCYYPHGTNR